MLLREGKDNSCKRVWVWLQCYAHIVHTKLDNQISGSLTLYIDFSVFCTSNNWGDWASNVSTVLWTTPLYLAFPGFDRSYLEICSFCSNSNRAVLVEVTLQSTNCVLHVNSTVKCFWLCHLSLIMDSAPDVAFCSDSDFSIDSTSTFDFTSAFKSTFSTAYDSDSSIRPFHLSLALILNLSSASVTWPCFRLWLFSSTWIWHQISITSCTATNSYCRSRWSYSASRFSCKVP